MASRIWAATRSLFNACAVYGAQCRARSCCLWLPPRQPIHAHRELIESSALLLRSEFQISGGPLSPQLLRHKGQEKGYAFVHRLYADRCAAGVDVLVPDFCAHGQRGGADLAVWLEGRAAISGPVPDGRDHRGLDDGAPQDGRYLEDWVRDMPKTAARFEDSGATLADRVERGLTAVREIVSKAWPHILGGISPGAPEA